jgi:cytidine deaminase
LLTTSGKVFTGCNVENASLGLTICAERAAVLAAVAAGSKDFVSIAVVSGAREPVAPCGACRQVLAEFNPSMRILAAGANGTLAEFELSQLLPNPLEGILKKNGDVQTSN